MVFSCLNVFQIKTVCFHVHRSFDILRPFILSKDFLNSLRWYSDLYNMTESSKVKDLKSGWLMISVIYSMNGDPAWFVLKRRLRSIESVRTKRRGSLTGVIFWSKRQCRSRRVIFYNFDFYIFNVCSWQWQSPFNSTYLTYLYCLEK